VTIFVLPGVDVETIIFLHNGIDIKYDCLQRAVFKTGSGAYGKKFTP
jgi:hypothetical protein